jgi:hypothetical protein
LLEHGVCVIGAGQAYNHGINDNARSNYIKNIQNIEPDDNCPDCWKSNEAVISYFENNKFIVRWTDLTQSSTELY